MADQNATSDTTKPARGAGQSLLGLIIIVVAAFAAAFGSTYLLGGESGAKASTIQAETGESTPKAKKNVEEYAYVELPEIIITIGIEPADRFLKVNLSIISPKDSAKSVKELSPVLIDSFNMYLRAIELANFEDPGFYSKLREQLTYRSELVLGAETSKGVLITEFLLR
jgi:flagellar FliL protein